MQKSRKDDFRMEEELRAQRAKYDESSDDVYRRMLDIKEAEADSVADLGAFLDAELSYYERAREVLLQLKQDWPAYVSWCCRRLLTDNKQRRRHTRVSFPHHSVKIKHHQQLSNRRRRGPPFDDSRHTDTSNHFFTSPVSPKLATSTYIRESRDGHGEH